MASRLGLFRFAFQRSTSTAFASTTSNHVSSFSRLSPPTTTFLRHGGRAGLGGFVRMFASSPAPSTISSISHLRNIGISAHIDSGKTTLTERILYYTGKISDIHEVKGKDGVGAKMDSMELEREKGITIQSAATHCHWGDYRINIIDTPGHVDFTIEVERALRVLDGAVLVMCAVSGVQSQTITVDRQMNRYKVPRLVFINKLDRAGSNPWKVVEQLREKLKLNAAAMQLPIGLESQHKGIVDLVTCEAVYFTGEKGDKIVRTTDMPDKMKQDMEARRLVLVDTVGNVDEELGEWMIMNDFPNQLPPPELLKNAIRRATISRKFVPVFMGAAYKNSGVQSLLDGVIDYLPNPTQKDNFALDLANGEVPTLLVPEPKKPFVALAFKLEEGKFGQLTYIRVYQGSIKRGDTIKNVNLDRVIKVPRLVKMHANEMEEINEIGPGEICSMFGVDCFSGNTFTSQGARMSMTSMFVPEPVMSLSITTKNKDHSTNFSKALARFQKEDPTFRVKMDPESNQTIISGMGELHLDIYVERMRREYNVDAVTGKPNVAYRETISSFTEFQHTHKKQTGGAGQYAKVCGNLDSLSVEGDNHANQFSNETIGGSIPPQFMEACRKGFVDACEKGPLVGQPVVGVKMVVNDGGAHSVDSSDLAFRTATAHAFRDAFQKSGPIVLEPIMKVEIQVPLEFQGAIIGGINRRKGIVVNTEGQDDYVTITCEVPLTAMFGYSTDLRSATQGKGEFTMEYKEHKPVTRDVLTTLMEEYQKKRQEKEK
eukprot:TRINITY_DN3819_c0_g1_i5.p1 TRINITY_DN3819_c0_g1~~TRINITY_DN3819_c0_g1_i5.p1  ORF type:complete len:770 (-),score=172.43 TRINITY_DN3819_c0_g1_i5:72-2381(-)